MAVDPLSAGVQAVLRAAAAGPVALPPKGGTVEARVAAVLSDGTLRLATSLGELTLAPSDGAAPRLAVGDRLTLTVGAADAAGRTTVSLEAAAAETVTADPSAAALARAIASAAARQKGLAGVFPWIERLAADPEAGAGPAGAAAPVPPGVREAAALVRRLGLRLDPPPDAAAVARSVRGSGLFLEADLARGRPVTGDLKAALLNLARALDAWARQPGAAPGPLAGGSADAGTAGATGRVPGAGGGAIAPTPSPASTGGGGAATLIQGGSSAGAGAAGGPFTGGTSAGAAATGGAGSPGGSDAGGGDAAAGGASGASGQRPPAAADVAGSAARGRNGGASGAVGGGAGAASGSSASDGATSGRPGTGTSGGPLAGRPGLGIADGPPSGRTGIGAMDAPPSGSPASGVSAAGGSGDGSDAGTASRAPSGEPGGSAGAAGPRSGPGVPSDARIGAGPGADRTSTDPANAATVPGDDDAGATSARPPGDGAGGRELRPGLQGSAANPEGSPSRGGSAALPQGPSTPGANRPADATDRPVGAPGPDASADGSLPDPARPGGAQPALQPFGTVAPEGSAADRQALARLLGLLREPAAGDAATRADRAAGRGAATPAETGARPEADGPRPPPRRHGPLAAEPPAPRLPADLPLAGMAHVARQEVEASIARIVLAQVASLPPDADPGVAPKAEPSWTFEIPLQARGETAVAQFRIGREGGRRSAAGEPLPPVWRVRFAVDLPPAGPVHAQVSLAGGHVSIGLWAERPEAAAALGREVGLLRAALEASDFTVDDIHLAEGEPPRGAAGAAPLVDRTA
jgi:hypothetical protein